MPDKVDIKEDTVLDQGMIIERTVRHIVVENFEDGLISCDIDSGERDQYDQIIYKNKIVPRSIFNVGAKYIIE